MDEFFSAKIEDLYYSVERDSYAKFTGFLDYHQVALARKILKNNANYFFWGGFEGAERVILCIHPEYLHKEDLAFPIAFFRASFPKSQTLNHRDVLGTLMALQIKREMIGDIIVGEGVVELAIAEHLKQFINDQLQKIGKVGIKLATASQIELAKEPRFAIIEGTVASLRLDSILALSTKLSRSKAVLLLQTGKVAVNHIEIQAADFMLKPGDIFSIRGYGKFRFTEEPKMTKKMRCYVTIYQYI